MNGTVYDKYLRIYTKIKKEFPELDKNKFYKITAKLSTWHYPKKRWKGQTLTREEAMVYEWILNNNYNPGTVYKWMLGMNTNKENQEKLKKGTISLKKAMRCSKPFKHMTEVEAEFMFHIKQSIQHYVIR